jgi:hypothetical protein
MWMALASSTRKCALQHEDCNKSNRMLDQVSLLLQLNLTRSLVLTGVQKVSTESRAQSHSQRHQSADESS